MREKNYVRDTATYGVILLISVLFVLLFSYSTSAFYPDYYECDQSEFLTMGKMWANGRLPYIEQFDHKGPIIFFVNMVGMQLMGTKAGVSIVQMCFMFFTLLSFYRICIKDNTNRLLSILLTVVFW